jgi:hypothetical protein
VGVEVIGTKEKFRRRIGGNAEDVRKRVALDACRIFSFLSHVSNLAFRYNRLWRTYAVHLHAAQGYVAP